MLDLFPLFEGFSTISSRVLVFLYSSDQSSSLCFDELEVFLDMFVHSFTLELLYRPVPGR